MIKNELEIYVHIPFCVKKCAYCDFLSGPADASLKQAYLEALIREISEKKTMVSSYEVTSLFLGGGTPSLLEGDDTARIFRGLREAFSIRPDAEITIEANPGTVTREKLKCWRECGVNRLSIGLQSPDNRELRVLGRIHTFQEFLHTWYLAEEAGFTNRNIDLMSALPGQTKESWEKNLRTVAKLDPEHLSVYSLIIEEGTLFHELAQSGVFAGDDPLLRLPDEDEEREIYKLTDQVLREYGYHRYEISNYAKEGKECRHNLGYWERKEYLGLGLGAASLIHETRFHNTREMEQYLLDPCREEEKEILTEQAQMEEFFFLGLRTKRGVSAGHFQARFHKTVESVYGPVLEKKRKEGLLEWEGDRIFLTERGVDLSNYVFSEFLLDL